MDVERLMALWSAPPDTDDAALAELRAIYTDPVTINGAVFTAQDLLTRIRAMQRAYSGLRHTVLEQVDAPERLVVGFRLRGTHAGPLVTSLGEVPATGKDFDVRVIDILTLVDDRIAEITMVADELSQLRELGVVRLS